jgi:hypothetical protein
MKKLMFVSMIIMCCVNLAPAADVAGWEDFVIRNSDAGGIAPTITDITYSGTPAKEFLITAGGMKAAWGTNLANGYTIGDIAALSIDRLDDYTRYVNTAGAYYAPYLNFWITDGNGNYATIANEPSNGEWLGTSEWDMTGDILSSKTVKVYEYTSTSWLPGGTTAGLTFADFADYIIGTPTSHQGGTGAADDLNAATYTAYGVNWIFGDTLSNYVGGSTGYIVANPTIVVPEPATMLLLGIGGLLCRKFRKA